jgi:hypothetical protein
VNILKAPEVSKGQSAQIVKKLDALFEKRNAMYDPKKSASENEAGFLNSLRAEIVRLLV